MSSDEDIQPLVIHNGSCFLHSGFSGDDAPRVVLPTVVGCPRHRGVTVGMGSKDRYVGDEAVSKRGILSLKNPVEAGVPVDFGSLEQLWQHMFYDKLSVPSEEHPVLVTEVPFTPPSNREKAIQIMIESFNVPGYAVRTGGVLALYASGYETGLVVDIGHDITHAIPVYNGFVISRSVLRSPLGGSVVTEYLKHLINAPKGHSSATKLSDLSAVAKIKEKMGYVSLDFEDDERTARTSCSVEKTYELPDGTKITLNRERFTAPECLFNPTLVESMDNTPHEREIAEKVKNHGGLPELVLNSIMRTDIDLRKDMYGHTVLAGGGSMFPGFGDRMQKEISYRSCPMEMRVRVATPEERKYSTWIGGSIISSLSPFRSWWILKEQYDEIGPTMVHKMCF